MAITTGSSFLPARLIFIIIVSAATLRCSATSISFVGVNYGVLGNNLPDATAALPLLDSINVGRVRLYDPDPSLITALSSGGFELVVGVPEKCIAGMTDIAGALAWVNSNLLPHLPSAKIVTLTVGNEVLTGNDTTLLPALVPAMKSLRSALDSIGLHNTSVTTTHNLAVLSTSFPPSSGKFRRELLPYITPLLDFLSETGSFFFVNAYPYFAYRDEPDNVTLTYALFEPNSGVNDTGNGLHYDGLLDAQVDAVYAAIAAVGKYDGVEVRVSETGWPSAGDGDEPGATAENAAKYNGNLLRLAAAGKGTPARPGVVLRAYIFALFNENLKPGPASERNYGLFKPDGTPAYALGVSSAPATENATTSSGPGGLTPVQGSPGYYGFSAAAGSGLWWARQAAGVAALTAALVMKMT